MKLKLIAAVSVDGAIGNNDNLLWHISEDLKQFKQHTIDKTLIIGANTFLTLPEGAKQHRLYFILSSKKIETASPHIIIKSKEELKSILLNNQKEEIWIVGGQKIYKEFIEECDEAYITWVNKIYPDANKRFPIDKLYNNFELVNDSGWLESQNGIKYKFCKYIKENKENC
jgi:dihydrofolate reductase